MTLNNSRAASCRHSCRQMPDTPPDSSTDEGQSRETPSILHLQSGEWFHFDLTMSQAVCRFAEVKNIDTMGLVPQNPERHGIPQHCVVGKLLRQQQRGYSKVSASSAVLSNRQYLHTGEAVGVFGQHHRVAV